MKCCACHTSLPSYAAYCHACGARQDRVAEPDRFEYAAFISYRHVTRDQAIAMEVQRAIETRRLPKGLSVHGNVTGDRKLGKCFRDEDELPAAHSLPDRITDALAKSRSLIVICSPDTPRSPWIQREVETFAQLHGRECIFAVLASGNSANSIPELLKTRLVIGDDGAAQAIASGPLAADLRPEASGRASAEKLRIIAAVAGCGYDDLRQRERSRTRKRIAALVVGIMALLLVVGGLAFAAHSSQQDALVAESQRLAAESQQLLARGDRYGAIEAALSALPTSSGDSSRPLLSEAQRALEDALQIHPAADSCWRADYSIQAAHPLSLLGNSFIRETGSDTARASAFAIDPVQNIFVLCDDEGQITTYDTKTGLVLAEFTMPESAQPLESGIYVRHLAASDGRVVASNSGDTAAVACFDSRTGNLIWSYDNIAFPTMSVSENGSYINVAQPQKEGGLATACFHMPDGDIVLTCDLSQTEISSEAQYFESAIGERIRDYYVGIGNTLIVVDQQTAESNTASLGFDQTSSLEYGFGTVVAASVEDFDSDSFERNFRIELFDSELKSLWQYDGTTSTQMLVNGNLETLLDASPEIAGYALNGTRIAIAAGRKLLLFERESGAIFDQKDMAQTIVAAQVFDYPDDSFSDLVVASSDGAVAVYDLTGDDTLAESDGLRLELPFPIRWAHACMLDDRLVVLAAPADATDRIVAFHTDFTHGEELGELDLDSLLTLAHDVLDEAGR